MLKIKPVLHLQASMLSKTQHFIRLRFNIMTGKDETKLELLNRTGAAHIINIHIFMLCFRNKINSDDDISSKYIITQY